MNRQISIASDLKNIKHAVDEIIGMLNQAGSDASDIFDIRLCLEEALINAIKYGNNFDKTKKVLINFKLKGSSLSLSVKDNGKGYNYRDVPDPTTDENILRGSGRGVFLIKHLMDEIAFNETGSALTMIKHLKIKTNN
jgi:serine/threonine-protein kinase RsbW